MAGPVGPLSDLFEGEFDSSTLSHQIEDCIAQLFFLAGADSLRDLSHWRRPERILERAVFVAVGRDGLQLDEAAAGHEDAIEAGRIRLLRHQPPPWSSTALRQTLGRGEQPPPEALHPAVARYIRKTGLYRPTPEGSSS